MNTWGKRSLAVLETLEPPLVQLCNRVLVVRDISLIEGLRDNKRQAKLLAQKRTELGPGQSKHNPLPDRPLSRAVDLAPYPIEWVSRDDFFVQSICGFDSIREQELYLNFLAQWYELHGIIQGIASAYGIKIRQGYDWDGDHDFMDQNFDDLPHVELVD
jgi:hypothetical protein